MRREATSPSFRSKTPNNFRPTRTGNQFIKVANHASCAAAAQGPARESVCFLSRVKNGGGEYKAITGLNVALIWHWHLVS